MQPAAFIMITPPAAFIMITQPAAFIMITQPAAFIMITQPAAFVMIMVVAIILISKLQKVTVTSAHATMDCVTALHFPITPQSTVALTQRFRCMADAIIQARMESIMALHMSMAATAKLMAVTHSVLLTNHARYIRTWHQALWEDRTCTCTCTCLQEMTHSKICDEGNWWCLLRIRGPQATLWRQQGDGIFDHNVLLIHSNVHMYVCLMYVSTYAFKDVYGTGCLHWRGGAYIEGGGAYIEGGVLTLKGGCLHWRCGWEPLDCAYRCNLSNNTYTCTHTCM